MTSILQRAIENNIPKLKMRTLPHPDIDEQLKIMMVEIKQVEIFLKNNIEYITNNGRIKQL